jgi:hypothetical protein
MVLTLCVLDDYLSMALRQLAFALIPKLGWRDWGIEDCGTSEGWTAKDRCIVSVPLGRTFRRLSAPQPRRMHHLRAALNHVEASWIAQAAQRSLLVDLSDMSPSELQRALVSSSESSNCSGKLLSIYIIEGSCISVHWWLDRIQGVLPERA